MADFLKGIAVGLGAVAPGLSGSILLVIFGLYQKVITAISTIFKNFWKNLKFLIPLVLGMGVGVLLFSNLVKYLLETFPMQTRFCFLGLVLGSLPLVFKEVKKEGFAKKYYLYIGGAFLMGVYIFYLNSLQFSQVKNPDFLQSVLLGLIVAASYIVPGIDSATILSSLGMYELWNNSLATLDFKVLIPAAAGAIIGVLIISLTISKLMAKCYTATFSIIFGMFLSIVPRVLRHEELGFIYIPQLDLKTLVSIILLILGIALSLLFSNLENIKEKYLK